MVTREIINFVNELFLHQANRKSPMLTGGADKSGPTQADKPSPKSSYKKSTLRSRFYTVFPKGKGHQVSYIANTNSMEPFLDDSDVVLLENLQGSYRDGRLEDEPFAPGQIVIYPTAQGRIIHTLKQKTMFLGWPAWYIQGHNNYLPDMARVPEFKISDRVVAIGYGRSVRSGD